MGKEEVPQEGAPRSEAGKAADQRAGGAGPQDQEGFLGALRPGRVPGSEEGAGKNNFCHCTNPAGPQKLGTGMLKGPEGKRVATQQSGVAL